MSRNETSDEAARGAARGFVLAELLCSASREHLEGLVRVLSGPEPWRAHARELIEQALEKRGNA